MNRREFAGAVLAAVGLGGVVGRGLLKLGEAHAIIVDGTTVGYWVDASGPDYYYGRSLSQDLLDEWEASVPKGRGGNATSRKPTTKQPPKPKPPRMPSPRGY